MAADLSSDRYQLSNYHSKGQKIITDEERLYELVPRLLLDFKISILKEEMKHTLQALNDPAVASNPEKCAEIMAHFKDLTETQNIILKDAGRPYYKPVLTVVPDKIHELLTSLCLVESPCEMSEVVVIEFCFSTPRICIHMCLASTTTITPSGFNVSWMHSLICNVIRSCTCKR